MRTRKYSNEQFKKFLRRAEAGMPIKEIERKHGFSDTLSYKCHPKSSGMGSIEAKRLRELELENGKLTWRLSEAHIDILVSKNVWHKGYLTNQT